LYNYFDTTFVQLSLSYSHYLLILSLTFSFSIVFDQSKKRTTRLSKKLYQNNCSNIISINKNVISCLVTKFRILILSIPNQHSLSGKYLLINIYKPNHYLFGVGEFMKRIPLSYNKFIVFDNFYIVPIL